MMHIRKVASMFSAVVASVIFSTAHANLLTGTITGEVTSTGGSVPGITTGSEISGAYTYDDSNTYQGFFGSVYPFQTFMLVIGTNPHVFTLADLGSSTGVIPGVDFLHSTATVNDLFFFFNSLTSSYFGGGQLTLQTESFVPQSLSITNTDPSLSLAFQFSASLGTPITTNVPEPEMLALLVVGMTVMVGSTKRRKRS